MPNEGNLIPNSERTPTERRRNASKGGKASGAARRARKTFQEAVRAALEAKTQTGDILSDMVAAQVQKALDGDTKAFEMLRDTSGEKPTDKMTVQGNMQFNSGGLKETLEELKRRD